MKSKFKLPAVCMLILTIFFACNNAKENGQKFELHGTLEGITDGKIFINITLGDRKYVIDSALIKNGKFVFKGDYPEPTGAHLMLRMESMEYYSLYIENVKMSLTGLVRKKKNRYRFPGTPEYVLVLEDVKITGGGKAQNDFAHYNELRKTWSKDEEVLKKEMRLSTTTKERKTELLKILVKRREELIDQYIKENPTSRHAADIVSGRLSGKSAAETEKVIKSLAPALQKNPAIVALLEETLKQKEIELGVDQMMAQASNVFYKVDGKFDGEGLKDVIYLGVFTNNNICALQKDGTVQIIDPKGSVISSFKPELKGAPASIAVDKLNQIYVLSALQKEVTKKVRGRSHKRMVPVGVACVICNEKGEIVNQYDLPSLKTATGARISDDVLLVADYSNKRIAMFDSKTGKAGASIEEMRPCCGILDFAVNAKKEVLVANLGAFRVQGFDFTGKNIVAFGQRGKSLDEFHGCCNPVSVNSLSNGAIVTVEKDPTRIKIYSKEGAKQIAGVEELVKGCSHIPMIVDAKDNLYLASGAKGIVKCVSVN
ncbi:DUF4369 domain-containing protein [Ancylomarina sp. DW003]|nr:DUF4369 domain-containing protein [Ancylomarina sp. DW003]MDE5423893.1 DUF4369 domain-containing protein [Ancylomarina sp. DW003]